MKIRLYMDEDSMSDAVISALKTRGIDVIAAQDVMMVKRDDIEQLQYAAAQNRVLCTYNVGDFYNLHKQFLRTGRRHAGMILVKQQTYSIGEQLRRMRNLIAALSAEDMQDRAEFLSNWK